MIIKLNAPWCKVPAMSLFAFASAMSLSSVAAQEEGAATVDEVIVTVERKTQSLQDLPATAGVLDTEALKDLNLTKMSDLDGAFPGLNIANSGGNIEVWIRGIGNSNNTELGNPSAATHMDGVFVPRPSGFGSAFFDIARVEVNFGPQGTLRGRQSLSGSVDVIPWTPGIGETNGMLEVGVGAEALFTTEGVLNLGINDNSAARFAFYTADSDPLYKNKGPSRADLGMSSTGPSAREGAEGQDNLSYRFSYLIEPTDNVSLTLTHDNIQEDGSGYTGTNFANPLGNGIDPDSIDKPRDVVLRLTDDPELDVDHEGIRLFAEIATDWGDFELLASRREASYDYRAATPLAPYYPGVFDTLNPAVTVPATNSSGKVFELDTTTYEPTDVASNFDYPVQNAAGSADDGTVQARPASEVYDAHSFFNSATTSDSDVFEYRFISNETSSFGLPLNWTAGAFFFEEDQTVFLGATEDRVRSNYLGFEFNTVTKSESKALYFDGTYDVADNFRVTAGYRHSNEFVERYGVNAMHSFALGNCESKVVDSEAFNAGGGAEGDVPGRCWGYENVYDDYEGKGDNGSSRYGTSGFAFAKNNRPNGLNPDYNNDGELSGQERVQFFLEGVATWGVDDNLQNTFANNDELLGGWWDPTNANNYVGAAALAANPRLGECKDGNTERTYDYDDGIIRDEGCLYNATLGYDIYTYATAYGPISMQNGRIDNDFDDWRVRFEYDVNPDWLTYFTVSSGHKSGGFNDNIAGTTADVSTGRAGTAPIGFDSTTEAPAYDGESVIYYELGSKSEFDLGSTAITLNSSAFYYDYNDMIVTTLTSVGSILSSRGVDLSTIVDSVEDGSDISSGSVSTNGGLNQIVSYSYNAAEAEIYGIHVDSKFDFENGVNLDVSAVLMDTEINAPELINDSRYETYVGDFIVAEMRSVDGHELPRSPKLQLRANVSRSEDLGDNGRLDWVVSAGYRSDHFMTIYNGRIYRGAEEEPQADRVHEEVDGYWTFDTGIGWNPFHNEDLRIEAYVNNVTNEIQPQAIIITQYDNTRFFNRERTFGARLRTKF